MESYDKLMKLSLNKVLPYCSRGTNPFHVAHHGVMFRGHEDQGDTFKQLYPGHGCQPHVQEHSE